MLPIHHNNNNNNNNNLIQTPPSSTGATSSSPEQRIPLSPTSRHIQNNTTPSSIQPGRIQLPEASKNTSQKNNLDILASAAMTRLFSLEPENKVSKKKRGPKNQIDANATVMPNGDKYNGELLNNKPHGKGYMVYAKGEILSANGTWENGIFLNGSIVFNRCDHRYFKKSYQGQCNQAVPHGEGEMKYTNSNFVLKKGTWENGILVKGLIEYCDYRKKYVGECNAFGPNGIGTMEYTKGNISSINGTWSNGNFIKGTVNFCDNSRKYEGEFQATGVPQGKGKLTLLGEFTTNSNYLHIVSLDGDWQKGHFLGGKIEYVNGSTFEGNVTAAGTNTFFTSITKDLIWSNGIAANDRGETLAGIKNGKVTDTGPAINKKRNADEMFN
jgi:hypothetical protein